MVASTPIAGLRYSQQTDVANAETGFYNLASDVDTQLLPRYATVAARTAAIPSPINGQASYITDTATGGRTLAIYNGTSWISYFRSPLFAYKTADESVTSSAALQNDDHLTLSVEANAIYTMTLFIEYIAGTTGDLQYAFTYPANASVTHGVAGLDITATGSSGAAAVPNFSGPGRDTSTPTSARNLGGAGGSFAHAFMMGLLEVGVTAGSLTLQWAQAVSDGTATTLKQGSWMKLDRIV